jgi:UDP-3-O-[3-hydroxymyristoyl] glucosamine N-acyltransferase
VSVTAIWRTSSVADLAASQNAWLGRWGTVVLVGAGTVVGGAVVVGGTVVVGPTVVVGRAVVVG